MYTLRQSIYCAPEADPGLVLSTCHALTTSAFPQMPRKDEAFFLSLSRSQGDHACATFRMV